MRARLWGALAGVMLLSACAIPGLDRDSWNPDDDYGTPGAVIGGDNGVPYYPACGNEILTFDDKQWFPFEPASLEGFPTDPLADAPPPHPTAGEPPAPSADAKGGVGDIATLDVAAPVGAVVAPGPGDDVGTLVIYDNDLAYWESDSGGLSTWLTAHEIEYNWVC